MTIYNSEQTVRKEIEWILAYPDNKKLISFLTEYAVQHADFWDALKELFTMEPNMSEINTNYSDEIEQCFIDFALVNDRLDSSYNISLGKMSDQLSVFWKKAENLYNQKSYGDVASIALQILRSIGKHYVVDQYWEYYDDYFALEMDCNYAEKYLMLLGKMQAVPDELKEAILKSLDAISKMEGYVSYQFYNVFKLKKDFDLYARPQMEMLVQINEMLAKKNIRRKALIELVERKIELLYLLNYDENAEATFDQYQYLPEIRKLWVGILINNELYEKALLVLDEGIRMEKENNIILNTKSWLEDKLAIYHKMGDIANVINLAQKLFIDCKGSLSYYSLLKQVVPHEEWKSFYNELIEQTSFSKEDTLPCVEADIYLEEGDTDRLLYLLKNNAPFKVLLNYSKYIKDDYPPELLKALETHIRNYVSVCYNNNQYIDIAESMNKMRRLKGGEEAVQLLLQDLLETYSMRRSMKMIFCKYLRKDA